ncbi:PEP-CTERM system TPR-repeat protein PrsT [Rhodoferax sp. 4810]|nr:PEP-CTERM system TPR-repeat protein PrsT [Rhodoferax jenense]
MHHITSTRPWFPAQLRIIGLSALTCAALCAGTSAWAADAKASKYYEDALTRFEKQDTAGAIIQLKNALQIDKNMLPVQMLLGKALLQNGDVVAAEVAFNEALRLGVNRAEVVVPLAQAYMAQGKQAQVLSQPLFAVTGLPPDVQLQMWLLKAASSADTGDLRAALKAVDEARALDARSAAPWLAEVPVRIRGKQFKEAEAAVARALELTPNSAEAWYQKGAVAHVSGNLTATLAAYDQTLKLDAKHLEARVARAGLYLDLNRPADAQADIDTLLRNSPNEPRGSYMQALLAERNNQPAVAQKALKDITTLLDPVPIDFIRYRPQLLMLNGLAHYGLNEPEKAAQALEYFQKVQGSTPVAKLLAQIYLAQSNTNRAIELLEAYLRVSPNDGQAMTMLAGALMSKGQNAKATALMQQALQTQDRPEFRSALGMSLIRSGQAGSGMNELEAAFKKDPRQTQAATALIGLYLRSNQAAKAVTLAGTLVKQQPNNAGFHNLLGMARGQSGKVAESKAAFEKAIALDPAFVQPKLHLARVEIATRAYDAAGTRLAAILKENEKNTDAMYEMALLSDRRGQEAEAQRWLEKATDLSGPKDTRWALALSDFHLQRGRPGPALEAVKKAAAKAPDDLPVLLTYARAQLASGDTVGAKGSLTSATRVAAYNPGQQVEIASLQMAAKNWAGASYSLDKALSTSANYLPAMALMSEVELMQGEPAKAEQRAREIVAKYPKRAVGPGLLGDIAQSRGQAAQALEFYRRAHQLEPTTGSFVKLFGAYSSQGDGKPALPLAEQWIKAHPKDVIAQRLLAGSYWRAGQLSAAKNTYMNLLKLTPDDSDTLNNLALVLLALKDPEGIKVAEQAVAKNPASFAAVDTLGWALFQTGQTDRSLQLLRDARLRQPASPVIRYHLAAVLAQTGRRAEAVEELEAALKLGSSFKGAADAQALLKTLRP